MPIPAANANDMLPSTATQAAAAAADAIVAQVLAPLQILPCLLRGCCGTLLCAARSLSGSEGMEGLREKGMRLSQQPPPPRPPPQGTKAHICCMHRAQQSRRHALLQRRLSG